MLQSAGARRAGDSVSKGQQLPGRSGSSENLPLCFPNLRALDAFQMRRGQTSEGTGCAYIFSQTE